MFRMEFLDRKGELARLRRLAARRQGGLAVVYGRRRIGKSRLLLHWVAGGPGLYFIADQSTPPLQRHYLAQALSQRFPDFDQVNYPDWGSLLGRLARAAKSNSWRGPLVLDEIPYLVMSSPELPSVIQRWIEGEAAEAKLVVALAGSSQRMMQGLALSAEAPLYGRAQEILEVTALPPQAVRQLGVTNDLQALDFLTAWGGVPRYWELASDLGADTARNVDDLVLDPGGPLHREPDRLLLEELPPAVELRPLLEAIGGGAHRLSEIAGRMGRPATSLGKAMQRLMELGLVLRETPFGEPEERSKRSLYRIADPFFRLWFRVVAPNRSLLAAAPAAVRGQLLDRFWETLAAQRWEELCRQQLPLLAIGERTDWGAGQRWWHGNAPEWDLVTRNHAGAVLLGECKWSRTSFGLAQVRALAAQLRARPRPAGSEGQRGQSAAYALFLPRVHRQVPPIVDGVEVVTAETLLVADDSKGIA